MVTLEDSNMHMGRAGLRWACGFIVLALMVGVFTPTPGAAGEYPYTAYAVTALRVRQLPDTSSNVLVVMPEGDAMTVIGESGSFLIVEYEGKQGFSQKAYITRTRPEIKTTTLAISEKAQRSYILLSRGSSGLEVRALQQALTELGFYAISVDGAYGSGTEKAVSAFQTANGILADGVASPEVQEFLYEGTVKNTAGKSMTVKTLPPIDGWTMRAGNTGDAVTALQTRLSALGYYKGVANGIYDEPTMSAVRAFQKKNGLDADGLAGAATQTTLYSENAVGAYAAFTAAPATATPVPVQAAVYPYETTTTEKVNMRATPSTKGRYLGSVPAGAIITVLADADDFVKMTYADETAYIAKAYVLIPIAYQTPATPSPSPTVAPTAAPESDYRTLQTGDSGSAVRALQEALSELNYYTLSIDGSYGAGTTRAVTAFQEKNALTVTGTATPETQTLLYEGKPKNTKGTRTDVKTLPPIDGVVMRSGDRGEAVGRVQSRLMEMGYYAASVTNEYDSATMTAVRAFQSANHLKADGLCGGLTWQTLFAQGAVWKTASPTPAPTQSPSPTPAPTQYIITEETVIVMQRGTRGLAVQYLQQTLTDLGYFTGTISGIYDTAEMAAVRAFQKKNGLLADGIAGYDTQSLLYSGRALSAQATATPQPTATPTIAPITVTRSLRMGSAGEDVKRMQLRLVELGYLSGTADGIFGVKTNTAVRTFQSRNSLTVDGMAGEETLERMFSSAAIRAAASSAVTPAPTTAAARTLSLGDSGDEVQNLQMRLIALGYLSGTADGIFGSQTYNAVKRFQAANRLSADGLAGSGTLTKLYSASAIAADGKIGATPTPSPIPGFVAPTADEVRYANWYTEIRSIARSYPNVTIYDFKTGMHWNIHMFSFGKHADSEPMTAEDTAIMNEVFGETTWTPRAVWVMFSNGRVYLASMHNTPHLSGTIKTNNFNGHLCIHFPRIMSEAEATGNYAVWHQKEILAGWTITQALIGQ